MKKQDSSALFGVIGLGRFGSALARTLAEAGKEVIAVDCDEQKVKAIRKYTDYAFVVDDLSEEALTEVGIQNCGTVGICIGEQIDISILTSMLVLNMGVPHVIAKASSVGHGEVLKRLGVTVVYPEADMAVRIGKRLISGNLLDYIALEDGVEVQRIQVNGKMLNKSIRELDIRRLYGINIIAIERDHRTDVEFSPESRFQNGDTILVIGKSEKIDRFAQCPAFYVLVFQMQSVYRCQIAQKVVRKFYVLFWRFMIAFDCLCVYNTGVKQKASRIARGIT